MPARSRPNRSFQDQVMGASEKPRDQDSLAYKVTIFYGPGLSASGIGYSETEALVAANKQIPHRCKANRTAHRANFCQFEKRTNRMKTT